MSALVALHPQYQRPQAWITDIYRKRMVLMMICTHADWFRDSDLSWVAANYHIWEAFEHQANLVWDSGRRHYSARTIGEYLRHETTLRESGDEGGFKVNDHIWPSLSRLYGLLHPGRSNFFERRAGQSAIRMK